MARFNHFHNNKYMGVNFSTLKIGDVFGKKHDTFSTNIKTGELKYFVKKTKETKTLFNSNFTVYIKPNEK